VRRAAALAAALALVVAGCGGDDESASSSKPRLVVSAAASLKEALTRCSRAFDGATVRLSFAGSDELAAQIRQGVKPDVYAAANTKLPDALAAEGRLSEPVVFASNRLVIAVPASERAVGSLSDLARPGTKLAIGSESVPVGAYTRDVLGRVAAGERKRILANVRSNEPDVKGIVGKLTQGAADAGFVYVTDVNSTDGALEAITLPAQLEPDATYGAGVVEGAKEPKAAQAFVDELVDGACADALQVAGFGAPPG
jgi:molybdate transport system substrate-binding protein